MKVPTVDTAHVEKAARALLDEKVAAVRLLAQARQRRLDASAALAGAEREDAGAWAAALRAGWTEDELKRVGLDVPKVRLPGRPRTRAAASAPAKASRGPEAADDRAPESEDEQ
ncbi:hypothetical protein [Aquipuribacter nitratireducens]|uniref:Uncharacterized protein n=1 Tax=Aquipuribacter nitratireducens TaxID=650104 RepID=A0ABW0GQ70_9MICO